MADQPVQTPTAKATTPPTHYLPSPAPFPPLELFEPNKTIGAALRANPSWSPKKAAKHLFPKPWFLARFWRRITIKRDLLEGRTWTAEELDQAAARGNFPRRPSDLFLRMYADVLTCLTRDPLAGNVSPPLIGTSGTIPLSIVSTIPDIMHHYRDCIVMAESEVFLVTNYWQPSNSVSAVREALIELNKRVGERNGQKIIVKIMWDRGAWEQLIKNHASVDEKTWVPLGVPKAADVPNLSLQIINFHRPLLGTFHQKALVVDRKVALLNSNNIQDRPNLEMMVHLEGPVVDSIYDVLLLSWHESFEPALACAGMPSRYSDPNHEYKFAEDNEYLAEIDLTKAAKAARKLLLLENEETDRLEAEEAEHQGKSSWWRRPSSGELEAPRGLREHHAHGEVSGAGAAAGGGGGVFAGLVNQLMEKARGEERAKLAGGHPGATGVTHGGLAESHAPPPPLLSPVVEVTQAPLDGAGLASQEKSPLTLSSPDSTADGQEFEKTSPVVPSTPQSPATPSTPRPTDTPNAAVDTSEKALSAKKALLKENLAAAVAKEASGSSPDLRYSTLTTVSGNRLRALSNALNAGANSELHATIDDETLIHDFAPHLLHRAHKPFPIAMVNRRPHGMPGHQDIRVPQNAAWLAGFAYAEKSVFVQTPTLNASPVVKAVLDACRRGIQVTLVLTLGFNDRGESIPFQGGTNEEVVARLYKALTPEKKNTNLHILWYTGKDQCKPVNAILKTRNCHVKFMAIDGQCAIVGNGNQDTQSWFHSQECNILIDNPEIVSGWMAQLETNQATSTFGKVDSDGIWRDRKTGETLAPPKSVSLWSAISAMI